MLEIHSGNQLEMLSHALRASYRRLPSHPFSARTIITESPSLARWLKQQFCLYDGIMCLIDTPLPAQWLWSCARSTLGLAAADDPLTCDSMQWLINDALSDPALFEQAEDRALIERYLAQDTNGLKRWQLAGRIADCFDRYQYYRPQMIQRWDAQQENHWQALLWRAINRDIELHRVTLMEQFINALDQSTDHPALPERLDLFSIHSLPPLLLQACVAISQHIPVNFWLLSPTPEYWSDLASPKQMARQRLANPDSAALWQQGNPLLVQWGRQGQAFQDLLLEHDLDPAAAQGENSLFREPCRNSLLSNVQADIYQAFDSSATHTDTRHSVEANDLSIHIDICHSPMRECQVLRDRLLHYLNRKDNHLQLEDIIVMVPEISRYAPYIKAVFQQQDIRLPYNLNDTIIADEHPLTRGFIQLLDLPDSRFTCIELIDLLKLPEILRRFHLDEADVNELAERFDALRIYWGYDDKDKLNRLGLPAIAQNTWQQGFERLMAGYALDNSALWHNIAPETGIDATQGEQLANFFELLNTLYRWACELDRERSPAQWAQTLEQLSSSLFAPGLDDEGRLDKIHDTISELANIDDITQAPLSLAAIRHWITTQLDRENDNRKGFYSGGITFCALKPLRGVPFKIVCLMGMQDSAFPRRHNPPEFDLMKNWRHGDPNPAMEDRYLFLETLLATRERFIISYSGRDIRNNHETPPAVVVQELIDHINAHYTMDTPLQTEQPLQAFSLHNYQMQKDDGQPALRSFDQQWLAIGKSIEHHSTVQKNAGWPLFSLQSDDAMQRQISLNQLTKWLTRPIRSLIQQRLKLYPVDAEDIPDSEAFQIGGLDGWAIDQRHLQDWLAQESDDKDELVQLNAEGMLPHGAFGALALSERTSKLADLKKLLEPHRGKSKQALDINIDITCDDEHWQISGRIQHFYPHAGIIHVSVSKFKPENLFKLWIEHICLQVALQKDLPSQLFCNEDSKKKQHFTLKKIDTALASQLLNTCLKYYAIAQQQVLPLIADAAYQYITPPPGKEYDRDAAIEQSNKTLLKAITKDGSDSYYYELLFRHHKPEFDEACQRLADQLLRPLMDHLEEAK